MKNSETVVIQYGVYWTDLDPTRGAEMSKTRPCVILSPPEMNANLRTILVAPVTSVQREGYPTRVSFASGDVAGWVALDQIRAMDKGRLRKMIGVLDQRTVSAVKRIIREMLVD